MFYILTNFFDGDRGFFSHVNKNKEKQSLIIEKQNLKKKLNTIEHKNILLSENINFDFLDTLIREKLKLGSSNEIVIKLNE